MLTWLIVIILAYFFFSLSSLGDKLILAGPPNPKTYTFFVGLSGALMVLLIPFANFKLCSSQMLFWMVLEASIFILALYVSFSAVENFEISSVTLTIGATQPIFIFILTCLLWGISGIGVKELLAFSILLLGSIIISVEKNIKINKKYFKIVLLASFIFSIDYVLCKFIFLNQPFLQSLIYMKVFSAIIVLAFLLSKKIRKEIFAKNVILNKRTDILFFGTQAFGGVATILQNFAIYLTPVAFLPILNSLRGIQYAFVFLLVLLSSVFFPRVLKEKISFKIVVQKVFSIILICVGLAILVA